MADISAWSPVDESNTSAPPAGWPEGMAHSAVNNSARAMMGAIRRWYDTVTAQLSSITTSLAGYLPLSGGSLTGALSVDGNIVAYGTLYTASDLGVAGNVNVTGGLAAGTLFSHGDMGIDGALNVSGALSLDGAIFADSSGGTVTIHDAGNQNITLYSTGYNYYDNNEHQFRSRGGLSTFAIFNNAGTFNQGSGWQIISDRNYKSDIAAYNRGLDALQHLSPVCYRYSSGPFAGQRFQYGLIAQDVEAHIPEMVETVEIGGVDVLTMNPQHAIWILISSCKELAARVEVLEQRVL